MFVYPFFKNIMYEIHLIRFYMKIQANELNKALKHNNLDEDSCVEAFDNPIIQKMHTPDISEKRKSMSIYKPQDSKRKIKKSY